MNFMIFDNLHFRMFKKHSILTLLCKNHVHKLYEDILSAHH